MREPLKFLREKMEVLGIDGVIVPTTDFHGSEYVNDYFKCREYLSGFTGSAGTLLVLKEDARLWTDGRYFLQAAAQLKDSGIQLMKAGQPGVPTLIEYLFQNVEDGSKICFDGRIVDYSMGEKLASRYTLVHEADLPGQVWKERPPLVATKPYALSESITGESSEDKLKRLRQCLKKKDVFHYLLTSLEDAAWLFNLRGDDVKHTPVFFAFVLIDGEKERLYVLDETLKERNEQEHFLPDTTEVLPYFRFYEDIKNMPEGKILLRKEETSYTIVKSLAERMTIVEWGNPVQWMKALKNSVEIENTKVAHKKDGLAMVEFLHWLKKAMKTKNEVTELDVARVLDDYRKKQGAYDLSFETIAGYGSNGAIIHYCATEETNRNLEPDGFLLVDSGGQYREGTTDITRTIALGPLTEEMKRHYTLVLKGHVDLAMAKFAEGTTGAELDELARGPLKAHGLNYNHGTGHGVGHLLSVHEGPNTISPRGVASLIVPGMITSNEPGLYLEGKYGIRLENEILCVENSEGMLEFETITFCPWEKEAILTELLSEEEIQWIDSYHETVYHKLEPFLDVEVKAWLKEATMPLGDSK